MMASTKLRRYCILVAFILSLISFPSTSQQAGNTFAGNLDPSEETSPSQPPNDDISEDGSRMDIQVRDGENKTFMGDEVDVVDRVPPNTNKPKKAQRPIGKAESVGFVPPPEEVDKQEIIEEVKIKEKDVVKFIPTLPPSIIKPGRMLNGSWYIVLYATWCEHSQAALSEFLHTVQYIVDNNIDIVVGKIDIIKHSEVAKHYRVKDTPTIIFLNNGIRYTFEDPVVSYTNLVNFMNKILRSSVLEVNTASELASLRKNYSVVFLIVHDEEIDQDWHGIYMRQAKEKILKANFAYTTKPEIVEGHDLKTLPSIIVLKEEGAHVFKDSLTPYSLSKWILMEKDETFPTINISTLGRYLKPVSGRRLAFLVVANDVDKRSLIHKEAIEVVKKLAYTRRLHQKFQFGLLEGGSIPKMLLQSRSIYDTPFFFVSEPYTGYYYIFQPGGKRGSISEDSISLFLTGVNNGKEERLGGVTYFDHLLHAYRLGYAVFQSMITHKPYLSLLTGMSVMGVILFYVVLCCQSNSNRPSAAEIRSRKAARAKRRKEELAKREAEASQRRIAEKEIAVGKMRDSTKVRKRDRKENGVTEDIRDDISAGEVDLNEN